MNNLKQNLQNELNKNLHNLSSQEVGKILEILKNTQDDAKAMRSVKSITKKIVEHKPIKIAKKDIYPIKKKTAKIENEFKKFNKNIKNDKLTKQDIETFKKNAFELLGDKNQLVLKKNKKTFQNVTTSTKYKLRRLEIKYKNLRNSKKDYVNKGKKFLRIDVPNYLNFCKEKVLSDANLLSG